MFICQESLYPGTVWHVFGVREDVSEGSGGLMFSIHASHLNHRLRCPLPGRQRRPITIQTCYYYHQRGGSAVFPGSFSVSKMFIYATDSPKDTEEPLLQVVTGQPPHIHFLYFNLVVPLGGGGGDKKDKKQPPLKSTTPCSEA